MPVNIQALNDQLVAQDDALRVTIEHAIGTQEPGTMESAMLLALCAIHERQGNMIQLLLTHGR